MKRIRSLRGLHVAVTGRGMLRRAEILKEIRKRGGRTSDRGEVTGKTDLLIRSESSNWINRDYGAKERRVAELVRSGRDTAVVDEAAFIRFIRQGTPMSRRPYVAGKKVQELRDEARAAGVVQQASRSRRPLDVAGLIKKLQGDPVSMRHGRAEQALLRAMLLPEPMAQCDLCGARLPASLLVASHIKPRAQCTARERLDIPSIAMRACVLGCDALYERGLLTVESTGRVAVSTALGQSRVAKGIRGRYQKATCRAHSNRTERYFDWHRRNVFQG